MTNRPTPADIINGKPEVLAALREFQAIYGDRWQAKMLEFHQGRYDDAAAHIAHFIRQIRNGITGDPRQLPQPEPEPDPEPQAPRPSTHDAEYQANAQADEAIARRARLNQERRNFYAQPMQRGGRITPPKQ